LLKIFIIGILLGIAVAAGVLHTVPVVDQFREVSIVSVTPNGGNGEAFHINIPVDRVMIGAAAQESNLPPGLAWPKDRVFENISTEIFKIRNAKNVVIGVAARTVAKEGDNDLTDWLVHLPARGSLFFNMGPQTQAGRPRIGELRTGSREFSDLVGYVAESWVSSASSEDGELEGRIELMANYVSMLNPVDGRAEERLE
jgi:hypothetical protein